MATSKKQWKTWLLNEFAALMVANWVATGDCYEFEVEAKTASVKKIYAKSTIKELEELMANLTVVGK